MMKRPDTMVCPKCGMDMTCHAEKPVTPETRDEAARIDAQAGIVVIEVHLCWNCGNMLTRRTVPA